MNRLLLFALLLTLLIQACQCNKSNDIPDVSHIQAEVNLRRFEKDLFGLDTLRMEEELARLEASYPEFSDIYFNVLLGSRDSMIAPEGHVAYVRGFVTDSMMRALYDTVQQVYPDLDFLERELERSFQYLQYYLPDVRVSSVTTFLSEYTLASFIYGENDLAVGLDFFLGSAYPYAFLNPGNPNFSAYLTRTYNRDHLVLNILKPLVADLAGQPEGNRLLDHMIHKGKTLYLFDHLLPFASDTVIMEFSPAQLSWCEDNELDMWAHFLREDLLYSSNWQDIRKLVEYSPDSPGMPPEAPGRTGAWLGWQIVKSFMKRNPEVSMQDLLNMKDAQEFLDRSKYRPRK
jgi:hypothetical protein